MQALCYLYVLGACYKSTTLFKMLGVSDKTHHFFLRIEIFWHDSIHIKPLWYFIHFSCQTRICFLFVFRFFFLLFFVIVSVWYLSRWAWFSDLLTTTFSANTWTCISLICYFRFFLLFSLRVWVSIIVIFVAVLQIFSIFKIFLHVLHLLIFFVDARECFNSHLFCNSLAHLIILSRK